MKIIYKDKNQIENNTNKLVKVLELVLRISKLKQVPT